MKYLLTILLLILVGCSQQAGTQDNVLGLSDSVQVIVDKIAIDKIVELDKNGKYSYVAPTIDKDTGIEYVINEYVAPPYTKESAGYQIIMTKPDGSKKSFGVGVEANLRSYDWTQPTVASSTPE